MLNIYETLAQNAYPVFPIAHTISNCAISFCSNYNYQGKSSSRRARKTTTTVATSSSILACIFKL